MSRFFVPVTLTLTRWPWLMNLSYYYSITFWYYFSQQWLTFSWLRHACSIYSRQLFSAGDLTGKVGHTDLVFAGGSGFISRSVRARLQVIVCSGYDLSFNIETHTDARTHTQHLTNLYDKNVIRKWDIRIWRRSILLPLLRLTLPTRWTGSSGRSP